jgi:hypothetical protein
MRFFLRPRALMPVNEHELAIAISEYEWRDGVVFYRVDVERANVEWHVWRRFSEIRDFHVELGDCGSFPSRFLLQRSYYNLTVRMLKLEQWLRGVAKSHAVKVESWLRPALRLPEPLSFSPAKRSDEERRGSKDSSTTAGSDSSVPTSPTSPSSSSGELSAFQLRRAKMRRAAAAKKAAAVMTKEEAERLCALQVQAAEHNERYGAVLEPTEPEPTSPLSPTLRELRYKGSFGEDLH